MAAKKTQAHLLLATLIAGVRERPLGVLRSTLYGPLAYSDRAANNFSSEASAVDGKLAEFADIAGVYHSLTIEATEPLIPKDVSLATSVHSIGITAANKVLSLADDAATSGHTLGIVDYLGIYSEPDDLATSSHSIQVTTL